MNRRPPILSTVARAIAILFAIFVVAWLVVNAQRNADRAAQEPTPGEPAYELEALPNGIDAPSETHFLFSSKSAVPAAPPFLPSTKIGLPGLTPPPAANAPEPAAPRFLPSSKTITPVVTPKPPVLVFPYAKQPTDAKPGTPPAPQGAPAFLPTSKSGRPFPVTAPPANPLPGANEKDPPQ